MVLNRRSLVIWIIVACLRSDAFTSTECATIVETTTEAGQSYWMNRATMVFVADVRAIEDSGRVNFDVLEAFKGAKPGRLAIEVYLEVHGFIFQEGQRVLVYGTPAPGNPEALYTSCSPTRLIAPGDNELVTLRRLAKK
jgi:hypothetical protein